jgi:histone H3/H4
MAEAKKKARGFVSKAPIRRLMKFEGASLVADDALNLLISKLESVATETTKKAVSVMKDEKRKRITARDIELASK